MKPHFPTKDGLWEYAASLSLYHKNEFYFWNYEFWCIVSNINPLIVDFSFWINLTNILLQNWGERIHAIHVHAVAKPLNTKLLIQKLPINQYFIYQLIKT